MDKIVKLPSGFYALASAESCEQYEKTGKLSGWYRADLVEWNGTRYLDSFGNWQEFPEKVVTCRDFENWYQDATGTVYIQYKDKTHCYMYSPGCVLYKHLCNMRKLARRRTA